MSEFSDYIRLAEILRGVEAVLLNECPGPRGSRLEFWEVPTKGVVVLQIFQHGPVSSFFGWPCRVNWSAIEDIGNAKS